MSGECLTNSQLNGIQDVSRQAAPCWSLRFWGELPNNPSDVVSIAHQDRLTITDQFVRPRRPTRGHWPGDCHDGIS
jgi:hypothetical protein